MFDATRSDAADGTSGDGLRERPDGGNGGGNDADVNFNVSPDHITKSGEAMGMETRD